MFSIKETSMTDYSQPFCQTFMTTWFSPDLFHALQIWRQPPVATEDLLVHWKIKDFVENSITNYLVGAHWQFGILDEKIFIIILILTQILRITSSENLFWKFCKVKYNTIQYNTIQYNTIQYNTIQYMLFGNLHLSKKTCCGQNTFCNFDQSGWRHELEIHYNPLF